MAIEPEPLVSICVSVFNEERFLAETLDCLIGQTYGRFEVLISDNASTDKTPGICRRYTANDPRFRLYRHQTNIGQVNNIGRCFAPAVGDLVLILSGNDLLAPTYLERVVDRHISDPEIGLVFTRSTRIDNDSNVVEELKDHHYFNTSAGDPLRAYETVLSKFRDPGAFFATYKRALLERLQPLHHKYGSDQIFVSEASLYSHIHCVDEHLFFSRVHNRAPLPSVFSEYYARGQPEESLLTRLDIMTPMMSHIQGHFEMIAKAQISTRLKPMLTDRARTICMRRGARRIKNEYSTLTRYAKRIREKVKHNEHRLTSQIATIKLLQSVLQALLVLPDDPNLQEIAATLMEDLTATGNLSGTS